MKFKIRKKQRNIIIAAVILTTVIIAVCVRSGVFKPNTPTPVTRTFALTQDTVTMT